jgi:D-alanyl-D-alanine carboxypeptidase/D-alanyl-D-alanine-endopeptidase (penicillin-binding protein 4)
MVYLLGKLQTEFGLERLKKILPRGGSGTLKHYYLPIKDRLYAKTGSVSNHFSLSGYLYTRKNRLLYFSVMTGSFPGKLSAARRAVEQFVTALSESVK